MNLIYDRRLPLSWSSFLMLIFLYKLWKEFYKYNCLFKKNKVFTAGRYGSIWLSSLGYSKILAATASVMYVVELFWLERCRKYMVTHAKWGQNELIASKWLWMSPSETNPRAVSLSFRRDVTYPSITWGLTVTPIGLLIWDKWNNVHHSEQIVHWWGFISLLDKIWVW